MDESQGGQKRSTPEQVLGCLMLKVEEVLGWKRIGVQACSSPKRDDNKENENKNNDNEDSDNESYENKENEDNDNMANISVWKRKNNLLELKIHVIAFSLYFIKYFHYVSGGKLFKKGFNSCCR